VGNRLALAFATAILLAGTAVGSYAIGKTRVGRLAIGPTWADEATAIATGVTALILLATAFFALRGVEDARRTRHGQLVIDLTAHWDQPAVGAAQDLHLELGKGGILALIKRVFEIQSKDEAPTDEEKAELETYGHLLALPDLIDLIGVLESEGVISAQVVHKMWGPLILSAWEAWGAAKEGGGLTELRSHYQQYADETYAYFESLAKKMEALEQRRLPSTGEGRRASQEAGA
jgi:hypothetical protein